MAIMKRSLFLFLLLPCFAYAQTAQELLQSGNQKAGRKDYQGAIADFDRAISINDKDANAYFYRANAYSNLHNNDAAVKDYTQTLSINPGYTNAYYYRG